MIGSQFYKGQGLGNQLWVYATVRSLAEFHGYSFGFLGIENFKGLGHFQLDFGSPIIDKPIRYPRARIPRGFSSYLAEASIRLEDGTDVSPLDRRLLQLSDGTFLDGLFQAEGYLFEPEKVKRWFSLDRSERNVCVVNVRGGEFRGVRDLFIPKSYYERAMKIVREHDDGVNFEIVTDDPKLAKEWFPHMPIFSSGGVKRFHGGIYFHPSVQRIMEDFERIQTAKYLILSNSSFSWWGAYTNLHSKFTIAPKYWARYNTSTGYWSNGDSLTRGWMWLHRDGQLFTYEQCKFELDNYKSRNR